MKKNQHPSKKSIGTYKTLFINTTKLVDEYLGEYAFSSFGTKTGRWTKKSNRSLYDAEMLAFSDFVGKKIKITPTKFMERLEKLMADQEFRKSLHSQAGGTMIQKRVSKIKDIISGKI